ncbi:MAG TPA: hypothetical protein VF731_10160 [Solirubrobacterales bacterium]
MPTKRRRHAVTETPPVEAALEQLRGELGRDRIDLGELVVIGANVKLAELRAARNDRETRRRRLADRIRRREPPPVDREAAEEAKRLWARY